MKQKSKLHFRAGLGLTLRKKSNLRKRRRGKHKVVLDGEVISTHTCFTKAWEQAKTLDGLIDIYVWYKKRWVHAWLTRLECIKHKRNWKLEEKGGVL